MVTQQQSGGVLFGLQYLRFVAALLVVLCHAWQMVPVVGTGNLGSSFEAGAAGVDIFFVISGFIMGYITAQRPVAPARFMLDRIARIAPPYWAATLLLAAVLIFLPNAFRSASFDFATLITSLFFIPWPSQAVPGAAPLLQIGWTLNYEMFFYAIFALSMAISMDKRRIVASTIIIFFISMQIFLPNKHNDIFQFYSSTIMLEFIFGMAIGALGTKIVVNRYLLVTLFVFCLALFAFSVSHEIGRLDQFRFLVWGAPAALLVACVVSADLGGTVPENRALLFFGNASYALYLTHLFALGAVRSVWPMMPSVMKGSDVFLISSSVIAALVVGSGFYLFVEKPLVHLAKSAVSKAMRRADRQAPTLAGD